MAKPIATAPVTMGRHGRMHESQPAEQPKPVAKAAARNSGPAIVGKGALKAKAEPAPETLVSELPEGPMSFDDVIAVLADRGIHPTRESIKGNEKGLTIPVPGGSITVERLKIKKCAGMDELREYVYGKL